jgi:diguanylate cyclase (GGDEF)-like protein
MMCRERMEAGFLAAARIDSLTGAANRGAFFAQADRLFRRASESAAPLSLIAFDLDHFKSINDNHGHAVGDQVLKSFAECAAAVLRPGDLFGRIGGEEFAALLPGASPEAAYVIADRVRHAFAAAPRRFGDHGVGATVSAGVATTTGGDSLEALLEAADRALYRAKDRGRNRVERRDAARAEPASNVIRVA